jgi:site-specific DNA recombinase
MDAYIRVSRVGDRAGEAYRSPVIQREEIERWADRESVELGKVVTEEDVSGGRPVATRGLEELIGRAERGETAGITVYRLDRFGRDMAATTVAVKRLRDAGARLVAVADGYDSAQPNGQVVLGVMSAMAEQYLENVKANWEAATSRAVEGGVHIAARAPIGYLRADQARPEHDSRGELVRNGRLVLDPEAAPAVRTAFEMRGEGRSYTEVSEHLRAALGRSMAKSSIAGVFKNRAYLGEARGPGGAVKKGAHEAIVSEELFAAVQPRAGAYHPRNGSLAEQALLAGLITCASCGHRLRTLGSTNQKSGEREASYVCSHKYAGGDCEAPPAARTKLVDEYVTELLRDDWEAATTGAGSAERQFLEAREAVREADEALDAWVDDPTIAAGIGRERFQRGLLARQRALEGARQKLWSLDDPGLPDDKPVVWIGGKPYVYEVWGENVAADRKHLRRYIASVTLEKADPKRRRWQPIGERVKVRWVGED